MKHPIATAKKVLCNRIAAGKMRGALGAPDRSRICMFHDVVPEGAPLPDEYACSINTLRRIVTAYQERGFSFVTLDALLDTPYRAAMRHMAVLTFDDGFSSVYTLAAPYLTEANVPFSVYVTTGYLGKEGYLSRSQLKSLAASPLCTIGSHLVTHPMTRFLSTEELKRELLESRLTLERLTGKPVTHLAFPYGSAYACSLRDVRLAKKSGYRSAALTVPTAYDRLRPYPDHALPRLNMPAQFM